jgi:hypothetical protein
MSRAILSGIAHKLKMPVVLCRKATFVGFAMNLVITLKNVLRPAKIRKLRSVLGHRKDTFVEFAQSLDIGFKTAL